MSEKTKQRKRSRPRLPPRAPAGTLERLAREQGVKPIHDLNELVADFWPADETADMIIETVRRWRREGG